MSDHRQIPEPGELTYLPKPSWAPAFLALGAVGLICGTFAAGFIFPKFVYAVAGALFAIGAFTSLVRGATRTYLRLPRQQRARGAALPVEPIKLPD
jgi:hypothetical protein